MAELKIKADSGGGTVSFKGPATTTSNAAVQLTLPVDDGTTGQYLKTDGSGALSWATVSSTPEGTAVLSTGEAATKYLRADGDNSCSWQTAGNASWSTMTKVALSGATTREFTGYPANTQSIIFGWDGMSHGAGTGASSDWKIRVGTGSTTYASSGYKYHVFAGGGYTGYSGEYTDGIEIGRGSTQAAEVLYGHLILYHLGDNIWSYTQQGKADGDNNSNIGFGLVTLGAALSAIQVFTHYSANDYDAGTMYTRYLTYD